MNKIMKRDGKLSDFNKDKIADAIFKAAQAVGGKDRKAADELADRVEKSLLERTLNQRNYIPTVEEVQDIVEKVLIETGHAKTAKAYILYREERKKIREEARKILGGRHTNMYKKLSLNALRIFAGRYLIQDMDGNVIESPEDLFNRVSRALAQVEEQYGKSDEEMIRLEC